MGFLGFGGKGARKERERLIAAKAEAAKVEAARAEAAKMESLRSDGGKPETMRVETMAVVKTTKAALTGQSPNRENRHPNIGERKPTDAPMRKVMPNVGKRAHMRRKNEALQLRKSVVSDRRKSQVNTPAPNNPDPSQQNSFVGWSGEAISNYLLASDWARLENVLWQISTSVYNDQNLRSQILRDGVAQKCINSASHPSSTIGVRQKAVYILSQVTNLDDSDVSLVSADLVRVLKLVLSTSSDSHTVSSAVRALRNLLGGSENIALIVGKEQCALEFLSILDGTHPATFVSKDVEQVVIREAAAAIANLSQFGPKYQNQIIRAQGIQIAIAFLSKNSDEETKYHLVKTLANCASESRWHAILVEQGAVVESQRILHSCKDPETVAEAARLIGNLALTPAGRGKIVDNGGAEELSECLSRALATSPAAPMPDVVNALHNLCLSEKAAQTAWLRGAVGILIELAVKFEGKTRSTSIHRAVAKETLQAAIINTIVNIAQAGQKHNVLRALNSGVDDAKTDRKSRFLNLRTKIEDGLVDSCRSLELPSSLEHLSRASKQVLAASKDNKSPGVPHNFQPSGRLLAITREQGTGQEVIKETTEFLSPSRESELQKEQFAIGQVLGKGGYGTVYLAQKIGADEKFVAIKQFHTADPHQNRLAAKEQKIWEGLDHTNVVKYEGCFFGDDGGLNLVVEYIDGWSLARHLSRYSAFPEDLVAEISRQILDGLEYLHANGVVHRDLKPANVMVSQDGKVKITDFGVSSSACVQTLGQGNAVVGTPWYIAPEMVEQRPYTSSVDIWSLGCTIIELATGKRPYHELNAMQALFRMVQDRRPPIPVTLSPSCRSFLEQCFIWDPHRRLSATELKEHPFLRNATKL